MFRSIPCFGINYSMRHRIVKKRGHRIANTASVVCYGVTSSETSTIAKPAYSYYSRDSIVDGDCMATCVLSDVSVVCRVVNPPGASKPRGNDASCVMDILGGEGEEKIL